MRHHAWGAQAVAIGVWEAVALAGFAPTVTTLVRRSRSRYQRRTDVLVGLWLVALGIHLLHGYTRGA